jgi:hypothetical protein
MNAEKIEIEVELIFEDFLRNIFWQSFKNFWFIFLLALVLSPLVISGLYALISAGKFSLLILVPILPMLAALLVLYSIYSSAKQAHARARHKIQWVFSEAGYESFTAIGTSEISWAGIEEIAETSKDFLLFPQKPLFIIIPKRFFSASQLVDFRKLVRENLGSKAKLKS